MDHPNDISSTVAPLLSATLTKFLSIQGIDHITSSPTIQNLMALLNAKLKPLKHPSQLQKHQGFQLTIYLGSLDLPQ